MKMFVIERESNDCPNVFKVADSLQHLKKICDKENASLKREIYVDEVGKKSNFYTYNVYKSRKFIISYFYNKA